MTFVMPVSEAQMRFGELRWLEPVGQAIAFGAFSLQFFIVDPASNNALRGTIENQRLMLERLGGPDATSPGNQKDAQRIIANRDQQLTVLDNVLKDDATRQTWRVWLFAIFAVGAILTIGGKAASIRYSTK